MTATRVICSTYIINTVPNSRELLLMMMRCLKICVELLFDMAAEKYQLPAIYSGCQPIKMPINRNPSKNLPGKKKEFEISYKKLHCKSAHIFSICKLTPLFVCFSFLFHIHTHTHNLCLKIKLSINLNPIWIWIVMDISVYVARAS